MGRRVLHNPGLSVRSIIVRKVTGPGGSRRGGSSEPRRQSPVWSRAPLRRTPNAFLSLPLSSFSWVLLLHSLSFPLCVSCPYSPPVQKPLGGDGHTSPPDTDPLPCRPQDVCFRSFREVHSTRSDRSVCAGVGFEERIRRKVRRDTYRPGRIGW